MELHRAYDQRLRETGFAFKRKELTIYKYLANNCPQKAKIGPWRGGGGTGGQVGYGMPGGWLPAEIRANSPHRWVAPAPESIPAAGRYKPLLRFK